MSTDTHEKIARRLVGALKPLSFSDPVTHVYNPLEYAIAPYLAYANRYGFGNKEVVFIGMNPGPWGMAQTGVPFGEIDAVTGWLGIRETVSEPEKVHPKRPVDGFACRKSEVSGRRLWGWAKERFKKPEQFFSRFFVANYCPLMFMEESGRNRTPDKLPVAERKPLLAVCDHALQDLIALLAPRFVVGIGNFAEQRLRAALGDLPVSIGKITHPSPANPRANKDWAGCIEAELRAMGIPIPS